MIRKAGFAWAILVGVMATPAVLGATPPSEPGKAITQAAGPFWNAANPGRVEPG